MFLQTHTECLGQEGALVDLNTKSLIDRQIEGSEGISVGRVVVRGLADKGCALPTTASGAVLGVLVRNGAITPSLETVPVYRHSEVVPVLEAGRVWVRPITAVTAGAGVLLHYGVGEEGLLGADALLPSTVLVAHAVWDTSASAGELAVLLLK